MPIIILAKIVFTIWMLKDAYERRVPSHWYWIILVPLGAVAYFFIFTINDFQPQLDKFRTNLFQPKATLEKCQYEAKNSPSVFNKLAYAEALYEHQQFQEAVKVLEDVLKGTNDNKKVLYYLALCYIKQNKNKEAIKLLKGLAETSPSLQNYAPCSDLACLYWENGQKEEAVQILEKVCQQSSQLCHKAEYADYLFRLGECSRARTILEEALNDHHNSPSFARKYNKAWEKRARLLLKKLA